MNLTNLALSMMAFGVMIGITSTHFMHVHHLVEHGVAALVSPVDTPQRESPADPSPDSSRPISLATSDTGASPRSVMPKVTNTGNQTITGIVLSDPLLEGANGTLGSVIEGSVVNGVLDIDFFGYFFIDQPLGIISKMSFNGIN